MKKHTGTIYRFLRMFKKENLSITESEQYIDISITSNKMLRKNHVMIVKDTGNVLATIIGDHFYFSKVNLRNFRKFIENFA